MLLTFEMKPLLALIALVTLSEATFREQAIGAKGYVSCRGIRQAGVFVQLFDEDTLSFLDSDDLMGSTTADINGAFCVKGSTTEFTDIDPYILIEHNCGYEGLDQKTTFFYYLNKEHIVEGNIAESIEHLGHIELLTMDAPVQEYSRRQHLLRTAHRTQHERIQECLPLYVTYKDFYEKEVFGERYVISRKELETEADLPEIAVEEAVKVDVGEKEVVQEEVVKVEEKETQAETELKIEEERVKLEKLKVEEERLHLERTKEEEKLVEEERRREEELRVDEERRREVERKREEERLKEEDRLRELEKKRSEERHLEEERRRQEEERREEERRQREEERKTEEEKARLAYEKAMEEYRKREEARQLEIKRREEASKISVSHHSVVKESERTVVETGKGVEEEEYDPCATRRKRHISSSHFDPCNSSRKLRG